MALLQPKTLDVSIHDGPDRSAIYHESEFCLNADGSKNFRSKFTIAYDPYIYGQPDCCSVINACITGIAHTHWHDNAPNLLDLTGFVNIRLSNSDHLKVYPCDITYNALKHTGQITIYVPAAEWPQSQT